MNDQNKHPEQQTSSGFGISGAEFKQILDEDQKEIDAKAVPAVIGESYDPYNPDKIVEGTGKAVEESTFIGGAITGGMGIENPEEGDS